MKIDDIDVFDSMRWLLEDDVDLNDRREVEKALIIPDEYRRDPETMDRFIKWCIKAARANPDYDHLAPDGWVPAEHA